MCDINAPVKCDNFPTCECPSDCKNRTLACDINSLTRSLSNVSSIMVRIDTLFMDKTPDTLNLLTDRGYDNASIRRSQTLGGASRARKRAQT